MEFEKLQKIISEVLNVDENEITMDTTFIDDLGADSLDVFQIMVEKYGVKAFALEADYGCCETANRYIHGGEGTAAQAASALGFQIYQTDEMSHMLSWMRAYNENVSVGEDLCIYGFDMQRYDADYEYFIEMAGALGADTVELRISPGFTYTDAIKACLRQNPKWLMLSEARSVEVTSLLEQWSTGVNGFTTIHLDDLRKLPDRICNMMNNVNDADRMENRIYRYVNVGILIRRVEQPDGTIRRYMDQLCFYTREEGVNKVYMIMKDGEMVSEQLPEDILQKLQYAGIKEPYYCKKFRQYREEGK